MSVNLSFIFAWQNFCKVAASQKKKIKGSLAQFEFKNEQKWQQKILITRKKK